MHGRCSLFILDIGFVLKNKLSVSDMTVVAFVWIYMSYPIVGMWSIFFYQEILQSQNTEGIILITWSVAYGIALILTYFLVAGGSTFKVLLDWIPGGKLIFCVIIIAFVGIIVGLLSGNEVRFIVGDSYKLLLLPLSVIVGFNVRPQLVVRHAFPLSVLASISFAFGMIATFAAGYAGAIGFGAFYHLIPLCFLLSGFLNRSGVLRIALYIAVIFAIIVGFKRGIYLAGLFVGVSALFFLPRDRRAVALVSALVIAISSISILGLTSLVQGDSSSTFDIAQGRVAETYEGDELDSSSASRIQEVESSWNYFLRAEYFPIRLLIFGLGSGATYDYDDPSLRLNAIAEGSSSIHNIHFTPMALLFRYGIVATMVLITAYSYMVWKAFSYMASLPNGLSRKVAAFVGYYGLGLLVSSMFGFTIIGEPLMPLMWGALHKLLQDERQFHFCRRP